MTDKGNESKEEKRYKTRLDYFEDELKQLTETCETNLNSKVTYLARTTGRITEDQYDQGKAYCDGGKAYLNSMIKSTEKKLADLK